VLLPPAERLARRADEERRALGPRVELGCGHGWASPRGAGAWIGIAEAQAAAAGRVASIVARSLKWSPLLLKGFGSTS
jgi:hypothetical protein